MAPIKICDLLECLEAVNRLEDIHAVASNYKEQLGFDHFFYGALIPTSFAKPSLLIITDQPDDWREHYQQQAYLPIDPTATHCINNVTPLLWSSLTDLRKDNSQVKKLFSDADDFGVHTGVSIPLHSHGAEAAMLSLTHGQDNQKFEKHINRTLPETNLLACYLHEALMRLIGQHKSGADNPLTKREQECLLWATEGKTAWEIAKILNISERTANFHINNVLKKLNVSNKQHAIAKAISMGLIQPIL